MTSALSLMDSQARGGEELLMVRKEKKQMNCWRNTWDLSMPSGTQSTILNIVPIGDPVQISLEIVAVIINILFHS